MIQNILKALLCLVVNYCLLNNCDKPPDNDLDRTKLFINNSFARGTRTVNSTHPSYYPSVLKERVGTDSLKTSTDGQEISGTYKDEVLSKEEKQGESVNDTRSGLDRISTYPNATIKGSETKDTLSSENITSVNDDKSLSENSDSPSHSNQEEATLDSKTGSSRVYKKDLPNTLNKNDTKIDQSQNQAIKDDVNKTKEVKNDSAFVQQQGNQANRKNKSTSAQDHRNFNLNETIKGSVLETAETLLNGEQVKSTDRKNVSDKIASSDSSEEMYVIDGNDSDHSHSTSTHTTKFDSLTTQQPDEPKDNKNFTKYAENRSSVKIDETRTDGQAFVESNSEMKVEQTVNLTDKDTKISQTNHPENNSVKNTHENEHPLPVDGQSINNTEANKKVNQSSFNYLSNPKAEKPADKSLKNDQNRSDIEKIKPDAKTFTDDKISQDDGQDPNDINASEPDEDLENAENVEQPRSFEPNDPGINLRLNSTDTASEIPNESIGDEPGILNIPDKEAVPLTNQVNSNSLSSPLSKQAPTYDPNLTREMFISSTEEFSSLSALKTLAEMLPEPLKHSLEHANFPSRVFVLLMMAVFSYLMLFTVSTYFSYKSDKTYTRDELCRKDKQVLDIQTERDYLSYELYIARNKIKQLEVNNNNIQKTLEITQSKLAKAIEEVKTHSQKAYYLESEESLLHTKIKELEEKVKNLSSSEEDSRKLASQLEKVNLLYQEAKSNLSTLQNENPSLKRDNLALREKLAEKDTQLCSKDDQILFLKEALSINEQILNDQKPLGDIDYSKLVENVSQKTLLQRLKDEKNLFATKLAKAEAEVMKVIKERDETKIAKQAIQDAYDQRQRELLKENEQLTYKFHDVLKKLGTDASYRQEVETLKCQLQKREEEWVEAENSLKSQIRLLEKKLYDSSMKEREKRRQLEHYRQELNQMRQYLQGQSSGSDPNSSLQFPPPPPPPLPSLGRTMFSPMGYYPPYQSSNPETDSVKSDRTNSTYAEFSHSVNNSFDPYRNHNV